MALPAVNHEQDSVRTFRASVHDQNERLDQFLASRAKELTRSRVQELIRAGHVRINEGPAKPSYRLKTGDVISIFVPPARPCRLEPERVDFGVVYEDSSLIVINKPPGVVIHPAPGHSTGTLVHGLLRHCRDLSGIGGELRPGIVHRLDKDTSGLMVAAKNDAAHQALAAQFKAKRVNKQYTAIVHGILKDGEGIIDLPIARHPVRRKEMCVVSSGGREAFTHWRKGEELAGKFSLLIVTPKTGRTHQIRVHLAHAGHPIAGDRVYGYRKTWWKKHWPAGQDEVRRQMLHAGKLGFSHPESGEPCEFRAPLPEDMQRVLELMRRP